MSRPFEIDVLRTHLREEFTEKIPEAQRGSPEEKERNFLSRALAAYTLQKLTGCSADEASASLVDGGGDGGIDAAFFTPTNTLFLVQSKYIHDGAGQPALGEISKFFDGVDALLTNRHAHFATNAAWQTRLPVLRGQLSQGGIRVQSVLVYSSIHPVAQDRIRRAEHSQGQFNHGDEFLSFSTYNLTTIGDWLADIPASPGVERVELAIQSPGWFHAPHETIYGKIPVGELVALYREHGHRLVAANIRRYLGSSDVNSAIRETVEESPAEFFYLNNGLTAYCDRMVVNTFDRANHEIKRVTAYGFSVVNGAQTLGAIDRACRRDAPENGFAFIRLVSLERCGDDEAFARRITESTNFQNRIRVRDFVSMDGVQLHIHRRLGLVGISYHYKPSHDTPTGDATNFGLEEATTARACLKTDSNCDLLSRIIAKRDALWDAEEEIFPDEPTCRYRRVFPEGCDPRETWRAVQTQRVVLEQLRTATPAETGPRRSFFENARWLLLSVIFQKLHHERGEAMSLSTDETTLIATKAGQWVEALWTLCETKGYVTRNPEGAHVSPRNFRSVFAQASDCKNLRDAMMAATLP